LSHEAFLRTDCLSYRFRPPSSPVFRSVSDCLIIRSMQILVRFSTASAFVPNITPFFFRPSTSRMICHIELFPKCSLPYHPLYPPLFFLTSVPRPLPLPSPNPPPGFSPSGIAVYPLVFFPSGLYVLLVRCLYHRISHGFFSPTGPSIQNKTQEVRCV